MPPHLSRTRAYCVFGGVLIAYTAQCELASYLYRVGYSQPFFLLYLTHSSYSLVGVLHYAALRFYRIPISPLLGELREALYAQLGLDVNSSVEKGSWSRRNDGFSERAARRLLALTILIAMPAGIWYAAISWTSMTSLTALYNLNAFWAYVLSIHYARSERWALRPALAVGTACLGVFVMTSGDMRKPGDDGVLRTRADGDSSTEVGGQKLFGDLLGLLSSAACGFYEVWYKRYIALPSPEEVQLKQQTSTANDAPTQGHRTRPSYSRLLDSEPVDNYHSNLNGVTPLMPNGIPTMAGTTSGDIAYPQAGEDVRRSANTVDLIRQSEESRAEDTIDPSRPPFSPSRRSNYRRRSSATLRTLNHGDHPALFLLHANAITAAIGVCTACVLWLPIPILHWLGWETFRLPPDLTTLAAVCGVCLCGVTFNAGFMILISLWGPVVTSVGNLFTLILVAVSDEIIALVNGFSTLSGPTLVGSGLILASFGMLTAMPGSSPAETADEEADAQELPTSVQG